MKKYLFSIRNDVLFSSPVTQHTFLLRAAPLSEPGQETLRTALMTQPQSRLAALRDWAGNHVHQGYIPEPHTAFGFCSTGEVAIDATRTISTAPVAYEACPTPLTRLEGSLKRYFEENKKFDQPDEAAQYWIECLQADFHYQKGCTHVKTTAAQAWDTGAGVCQDFTHLFLALMRAQGFACHYMIGVMQGEGASHAWAEYWNGLEWISVDPTHHRRCTDAYMRVSRGLDASTCPLERGVFMGEAEQQMQARCSLIEI